MSAALAGADAVRLALETAAKAGASAADAVLVESESVEVRVRVEEIDFVKQAREHTLGIRVFHHGPGGLGQAITSTSDLDPDAVAALARDAAALARATAPDPCAGLPEAGFGVAQGDLALADAEPAPAVEQLLDEARASERAARAVDPRIVNSEGSERGCEQRRVWYACSAGFEAGYASSVHSLACMPVAGEGDAMQTDHWFSVSRSRAALESPEAVGRRAAERALGQLGARRVATADVPVIFDPTTARSLLANLAACLSGGAVYRRSSFLAERRGQSIAAPGLTLLDDGTRPAGLGSKPFDGEGLPTRRKVLVERGRLEGWLLDTYSARKLGLQSTGNASRSPGSAPGVAPTNLWIEPGDASLEEMVQNTPRGLLVTGLFGHGFNPVTGDFSRGARGYWIEAGRRVHPVEEITVAGNLGEMLEHIDAIGDELLWLGNVAAPALRVSRMTVAGE